jgi:hypothetical protein
LLLLRPGHVPDRNTAWARPGRFRSHTPLPLWIAMQVRSARVRQRALRMFILMRLIIPQASGDRVGYVPDLLRRQFRKESPGLHILACFPDGKPCTALDFTPCIPAASPRDRCWCLRWRFAWPRALRPVARHHGRKTRKRNRTVAKARAPRFGLRERR